MAAVAAIVLIQGVFPSALLEMDTLALAFLSINAESM